MVQHTVCVCARACAVRCQRVKEGGMEMDIVWKFVWLPVLDMTLFAFIRNQ